MKKLLFLLPIFLLVWCSDCDQSCYEAKTKYEEQQRVTMQEQAKLNQEDRDKEVKRQKEIMNAPWYKESLELDLVRQQADLQKRQTEALEKQANDVWYMRDSQEVKDIITVATVWLWVLWALLWE